VPRLLVTLPYSRRVGRLRSKRLSISRKPPRSFSGTRKKRGRLTWVDVCGFGCLGCGCLVLLLCFTGPAPLAPVLFPALYTSSGEHLPNAKRFSPAATNYSYYITPSIQVHEFDIPKKAFFRMSGKREYVLVAIETLPNLPPLDYEKRRPLFNPQWEKPLTIKRYVYPRKEHKDCRGHRAKCNVDPSGMTDNSCFRSVSFGYYYELRLDDGSGFIMLYDSKNERCYMHWNRN